MLSDLRHRVRSVSISGGRYKRAEDRKRVAGINTFSDGVKLVILKFRGTDPVNAQSVQDRSEYFATEKPK